MDGLLLPKLLGPFEKDDTRLKEQGQYLVHDERGFWMLCDVAHRRGFGWVFRGLGSGEDVGEVYELPE